MCLLRGPVHRVLTSIKRPGGDSPQGRTASTLDLNATGAVPNLSLDQGPVPPAASYALTRCLLIDDVLGNVIDSDEDLDEAMFAATVTDPLIALVR